MATVLIVRYVEKVLRSCSEEASATPSADPSTSLVMDATTLHVRYVATYRTYWLAGRCR